MFILQWIGFASLLGATFASPDRALAKRSTVSDILTDIENTVTCAGCEVNYLPTVENLIWDISRLTIGC